MFSAASAEDEAQSRALVLGADAGRERFKTEMPRSKLITIRNVAHLPSLEHPDQFNPLLSDFLKSSI